MIWILPRLSTFLITASEFSKLITNGRLKKLKCCQMTGCENIFVGPTDKQDGVKKPVDISFAFARNENEI